MKHIYLIGDIHGDFRPIRNFSQRHIKLHKDVAAGDENILICLGDFGANFFFNYRDEKLKEKLGKYNFTYFVIRGNHEQRPSFCEAENPELWHREIYFDNVVYVENEYPYIKAHSTKSLDLLSSHSLQYSNKFSCFLLSFKSFSILSSILLINL